MNISKLTSLFTSVFCFAILGFGRNVVISLSANDYYISPTDSFPAKDDMYSGFMPLNLQESSNKDGALFFWLVKTRKRESPSDKLVIWLNGGPGCSSMVGMMWENGPFSLRDKVEGNTTSGYAFDNNVFSWNEVSNVLYVEQPLRTGFSLAADGSPIIDSEQKVAKDFHLFLNSFLKVFEDLSNAKVFITGESYAGAYIPWIAYEIVSSQLQDDSTNTVALPARINLEGIAIGNGVIDDAIQLASYTEYAYNHGLIPLGAKKWIDDKYNRCLEDAASRQDAEDKDEDGGEDDGCDVMALVVEAAGGPNEYDTGTFLPYDRIIKPNGVFDRFFNDPAVQEKLHVRGFNLPGLNFVPEHIIKANSIDAGINMAAASKDKSGYYAPKGWSVCNDDINSALRGDHPETSVPALQFLVKHIRVLLYSGERDLNTNFLGTLHTLEAHEWGGQRWSSASRSLWKMGREVAGEYFNLENLSFLIVRNSGHLLPMDIPATALEMIDRFSSDVTFADVSLPSEKEYLEKLYRLSGGPVPLPVPMPLAMKTHTAIAVSIFLVTFAISLAYFLATKCNKSSSSYRSEGLGEGSRTHVSIPLQNPMGWGSSTATSNRYQQIGDDNGGSRL